MLSLLSLSEPILLMDIVILFLLQLCTMKLYSDGVVESETNCVFKLIVTTLVDGRRHFIQ